jgi:hypothetical protein
MDKNILNDFLVFCKEFLKLTKGYKLVLSYDRSDIITTAYYVPSECLIKIYVKDRALVDVLRSIAHELVHHKQNINGELNDLSKDGSDGSPIENEANSLAGEIIRIYGKINSNIYV